MSHLEYHAVHDIGEVTAKPDEQPNCLKGASVAAVFHLKKIKGCVACKKKVEPVSETLGQCVKCSAFQRLDKCADDISIKLLTESDGHRYNLHAYLPVICHIVDDDNSSTD